MPHPSNTRAGKEQHTILSIMIFHYRDAILQFDFSSVSVQTLERQNILTLMNRALLFIKNNMPFQVGLTIPLSSLLSCYDYTNLHICYGYL